MYSSTLLFMNIGGPEMVLIFLVALLLFGGKKLPELARGLGKGLREFKDASEGIKREIHNNINAVSEDINSVSEAADLNKMDQQPENNVSDTPDTGIPGDPDADDAPDPAASDDAGINTEQTKIAH